MTMDNMGDVRSSKVDEADASRSNLPEQPPPPYQQSSALIGQSTDSNNRYRLYVDYKWKKLQNVLRESSDTTTEPLYVIKYNFIRSPNMVFSIQPEDRIIGTSTLKPTKLPERCILNDKPLDLTRIGAGLASKFEYSSQILTNASGGSMKMTWISASAWAERELHCLDEQSNGVARFLVDTWNFKRAGVIEFLNRSSVSDALRDEIVVTAMTLACQAAPGSSPVVIV